MSIIVEILVIQVQQALSAIQRDSTAPLVTAREDGAILRLGQKDLSVVNDETSMTDDDISLIPTFEPKDDKEHPFFQPRHSNAARTCPAMRAAARRNLLINIMIVVVVGGREVVFCALWFIVVCELLMHHTELSTDQQTQDEPSQYLLLFTAYPPIASRADFIEANVAWPYSLLQWLWYGQPSVFSQFRKKEIILSIRDL